MIKQKKHITREDIDLGYKHIKRVIDTLLDAYQVQFIASSNAPSKYKDMVESYNDKGLFIVYNGGDHGLLDDEYNIKFRALHDYMHISHNLSFSYGDEKRLSDITAREFSSVGWDKLGLTSWECFVIRQIIDTEIRGQIEYYEKNGHYVPNQTEFIVNELLEGF
jgi:uncharacterized protein YfbU (UPF0304 family)